MWAVAFELDVAQVEEYRPKGAVQAYADIGIILVSFGFVRIQTGLYTTDQADLTNLFKAIDALRAETYFSKFNCDIRVIRIRKMYDLTSGVRDG